MKNKKMLLIISIIVVFVIVAIQTYSQRALQARVRDAAHYMAQETNAKGATLQYEPYYLTSNYQVDREPQQASATTVPSIRKLIKKADISLKVKDCAAALGRIKQITQLFSGILIEASVQSYANNYQTGKAVLKVAPKDFDGTITKIKELGYLENEKVSGDDVTEEYVDLTSRLSNMQHVRERLIKILENNAGTVKDILEVEREIARVGEQMEQIQGRMKFIDTQVALSTITVNFNMDRPIAVSSINFLGKFKNTIRDAIISSIDIFNGFIFVIIIIVPFVFWVGLISLVIYVAVRIFKRKK